MKYQNLLARTGEVSQDAIHRALEELWMTPVTKKDTFDLPEGTTLDDLYKALRDGNEGVPTLRKQIERMVADRPPLGRILKEGATPEELYRELKDARRDPADLVLEPTVGMEGGGWPRLLTDRDREDYLKANLRDYGGQTSMQVASGIEGENPIIEAFDGATESGQTVQIVQSEAATQGPLMDPSKMRQVSDLREVNTPHRGDTTEETPEEDWDLFPGETIPQAVGRIRYALGLYPTAARFGPGGPHPGLCRGTPEGCDSCGFPKEKTDHCHRYEVCGDCLGFGNASCGTALKMERYAEESK